LRQHPVLGPLTAATVVYYLGAATGFSLLVLLVLESAGGPAWSFGVVLACGAAGAFLGTLASGRLVRRFGPRATLSIATALDGLGLAALAVSTSVPVLAAVWFVASVPAGVRIPVARSLQQRLTPNHLLGRVNVTSRMFTRGIIVIGALGSGALATAIGLRTTFVVGGAVEVVSAVLIARALTIRVGGMRVAGDHPVSAADTRSGYSADTRLVATHSESGVRSGGAGVDCRSRMLRGGGKYSSSSVTRTSSTPFAGRAGR
jgi:MFS family permease